MLQYFIYRKRYIYKLYAKFCYVQIQILNMECTSDLDLEEIESRLYSQVFHSTEDWESDSVTPNMILNDMSNRHVSNYTVNNVTHSNANRYWCGQNSVMISPQTMRPAVPFNHVPNKKMPENGDRQEQLRKNRELRKQLKRQKKQNKRREKKLAKKLNSILVNNSATVDNGSSILVNNSATVDNGKYCNNPAAKCAEIGVNTSYNSGMFADDSIIYQRIDVPSPIHEPASENVTNDDVQSPVMQQLVSSTSNVVNDNDADVIVLSDDSDSDSVMEVLLPPPPIYTVDSSNDSDTSVSSKKGQVNETIPAAPDVDVNVSVENSLLGSNEKSMGTSHDTNVIVNVADGLNTSLILVENTSDNKELETLDQDDLTLRDDTSILDGIPKAKEVTNSSDVVGITEEERTALLCSPDSNTNDFIANDVDNMNKNAWGFNFMLHGSDLDLSNKDPEKLNRTSGVPSTDIYETESSCSEAGTFISKAPVFHEIDFESPTKEIFCEPNLTSFSKFITPVRKTKSLDASKTSPRLSRVKTKALSLIERISEHTTKDGNTTQEKAPCDTDEYNSDATMLQVKKKSKKKKKKNKKNKDKLNAEADSEMVEEVNANSEAVVNTESRKSNSKNETDNKIVASEKSKKSSNKNTNDEKNSDKEKGKKSSNKSEDDDKQEKNENKNKKQLKIIRDLTANIENSEKIIQHDDVGVDIDKSGSSDKNKKPKKVSSRDIPGNSLNSDMNIVTITEQQITSQLPSKTGNEFSFVETLNKIENKSEEESAEGKVEITDENITMANDIEKGTLVMESSSGENGGLKRFSFVGTWNKLNQQSTENQESSALGVNLNISIEQNTSIECNQTTDQDPLTCSDRNKSTEPLNEYISLNFMEGNEKITENLESSKSPNNVEIESNQTYTSSENNSSYVPQTLKSNDPRNRNKNIQHSPSENPGSSSSKKPKKSERTADVIVLSSDSDSDTEFNSLFKFYKDPDKDINISENFMLNTSTELNKSFDIDAAGTSSSNVRISKYNLVVNPFSVGKMKKSFKDYWTSDMARFYDESWGQENYDIQQVLSSMPSDKSKWKIILEDQRPCRQSRKRGPVCLRCREPGHPQFRCTRYPGPVKCSTCGCSGHAHTRCPNLMCTTCGNKGGYHTTSCYKCAHYARIRCNVCNMSGHLNTNCPDLWRRYHLTTQDTLYLSSSQTNLKPITQRWCSHCARRGHFQDACPYGNFEHFPTNNRIMSYDPLYNRTVNFLTSKPEEENIPMLPNTTLSDIRNYKDTIIEHNNKKYENILKTLRRQCMKSNLQYVDQINKIEKSLKQNQFSRKNIGNIYKIRSLIQKHARD